MATRFLSLSRSVLTNKQALTSFLSRSYSVSSSSSSLAVSQFSPLRLRSLVAAANLFHGVPPASVGGFRAFSSRFTQSSLNDSSPNWSNRPPKETILLDGCDFEHWLVVLEKPDENATREEIIDSYIKTLAQIVGSEEEARMKIYSVSTRHYFAFGALVSEELSYKLKELPNVRWVLPDSYLDVKNKDYGGEPFINGEAVPYDPKYHEEWVRNNAKAMERNRRNDRPRNFDRSRNFERRRQNQGPPMGGPPQGVGMPPNMGGPPQGGGIPPNMGGAPNVGGMPPNMGGGAPNMGGPPPAGGMHYNNMDGAPNMGGVPRNNMGGQPHMGGGAPPNMGPQMRGPLNSGWQGNAQNFQGGGGFPPPNSQGPPPNYQGPPPNYQNSHGPPPNYQNSHGPPPSYQNSQGPPPNYQNSQGPPPNYQNYGPPGGNQYQSQDMPPPPPSPPRNY